MTQQLSRIAVIGAGLIGERHAQLVSKNTSTALAALVDPRPEVASVAERFGCKHVADISALNNDEVDAAIIATPNHSHYTIALACLEKGLPCLVEKPITDKVEDAEAMVHAFETAHIPLLVGHHRRYHPFVARARDILASGKIGVPVCASTQWAVKKPSSYFDAGAWRLGADGGPIMINFIHEIDMMRCLFGELVEVQAMTSNAQRKSPVEDTAAMILRFETGLIATALLSDAALTPWSFEGASAENPHIAETSAAPWRIGCSEGAMEFPLLKLWQHKDGAGDWSKPLEIEIDAPAKIVPLQKQLEHFVDLVRNPTMTPIVSGRDGLESLRATRAVLTAAETNKSIMMQNFTL